MEVIIMNLDSLIEILDRFVEDNTDGKLTAHDLVKRIDDYIKNSTDDMK